MSLTKLTFFITLMKAPAGTGFIIQALIFMGIVAGALSLIGFISRR